MEAVKEAYSTKEVAELLGIAPKNVIERAAREGWHSRLRSGRGGGHEWFLSSMPEETRLKVSGAIINEIARATEAERLCKQASGSVNIPNRNLDSRPRGNDGIRGGNDAGGGVRRLENLPPSRQRRAEARALVTQLALKFAAANGMKRTAAFELFSHSYNSGETIVAPWVRETLPHICRASLMNWSALLSSGPGMAALAGRHGHHRKGAGALDQPYIRDFCLAHIYKFPHAGATQIFRGLAARLDLAKRPEKMPSLRRLQAWYKNFCEANRELLTFIANPDLWRSKFRAAFGDAAGLVDRLNQEWEMDSTPSDLLLADGKRHTIVACIDVYSRRVKFHVSRTSSAHAVATCLRKAILAWGVPELVRTDNGADYVSNHFSRVLLDMDILPDVCAPFSPEQKPFVERVFKSFLHDNLELLTGFTGHNVSERKALEARESFAKRMFTKDEKIELRLTPEELQKVCDGWADNSHMHRVHSRLGVTPYEQARAYDGIIRRVAPEHENALRLLFLPCVDGDGLRRVTKKGVRVFNDNYLAPELALHIGRDVQVRMDDEDHGAAHIYNIDGTQFICTARGVKHSGLTGEEVRSISLAGLKMQKAKVSGDAAGLAAAEKAMKVGEIAYERMLADDARARRIEAEKPLMAEALEIHSTPELEAAAEAARPADHAPAPITDAEREAMARAEAAIAACAAKPKPTEETPEARYARARDLESALALGAAVAPQDADWLRRYQTTPEYDAQRLLYEFYGDQQVAVAG